MPRQGGVPVGGRGKDGHALLIQQEGWRHGPHHLWGPSCVQTGDLCKAQVLTGAQESLGKKFARTRAD